MSESAIATSIAPPKLQNESEHQQKSPSPSNENTNKSIEEKSDDECLIIDEPVDAPQLVANTQPTDDPPTDLDPTKDSNAPKSPNVDNTKATTEAEHVENNGTTKNSRSSSIELIEKTEALTTNVPEKVDDSTIKADEASTKVDEASTSVTDAQNPQIDSNPTTSVPTSTTEDSIPPTTENNKNLPSMLLCSESMSTSAQQVPTTTSTNANTTTTSSESTAKSLSATEPRTLAEVLQSKTVKKPRQRNPKKKPEATQQMVAQVMPNGMVGTLQMSSNGQVQSLILPPGINLSQGIKINQFGQIVAVSSSGSPNQPIPQPNQLRQYTPQYYVPQSTANGQFICLPGAPTTQPQQQANIGQSTGQLQTGNKGGRGSKTGKDKEQGAKNVPQTQPQNPMMLMQGGNYRLQMAPSNQPPQLIQQQSSPMIMKSMANTPTSSHPTLTVNSKSGHPTTSTSMAPSYLTQGGVVYSLRGPSGQMFRPAGQPVIMNPGSQFANLIPINMSPNMQYQFVNTLNVADIPPPPTLSPNPMPSKSPKPVTGNGNKKKKSATTNGSSSNGNTTKNGMFSAESAKFMNDYKPSIPKSMQLKSTPTMTKPHHDEKMEVDTDLNDDEPPPKIECEGHADRESGSDDLLAQRQKANYTFLHAAHQQQQQKLASQPHQPLIKKHFVDGRTIEEEIPASKILHQHPSSSPSKQRRIGQPPFTQSTPSNEHHSIHKASKTVLNNFVGTLNRGQTAPSTKSSAPFRPLVPPPVVKPANYSSPTVTSPTATKDSRSPSQQIKKEPRTPIKGYPQRTSDPSKPMATTSSSNGQSQKQKMDIRIGRGRPRKVMPSSQNADSDPDFNIKHSASTLSKSLTAMDDRPRQKKNREVENLINMDFGPGKTPFDVGFLKKTTSADRYTENILTSRERMQSHGYDGRHSRSSVVSNSSRQAPGRRTSQRQPSASNLSPPSTKRPRRDAQRNVIYKHSPDFEEEDDDGETEDNDSQGDAMEVDRSLIKEETRPVNTCLYCKQPARDPNSPQYCSDNCRKRFKKKQRLESHANKCFNASSTSTASFKSEPTTSTPQPSKIGDSARLSLDNSAFSNSKLDSLNSTHESNGGSEMDTSSRELNALKAIGVRNWSITHVARWAEIVCGSLEIGTKFLDQEIDGDSLLLMEENDFKQDLGLKLGPYMKLMKDLKKIKSLN